MPLPALDVSNLHHRYGDREALRGLGFTVPAGEIFALLGPNGGGKTTLVRIISTLMRPTSGQVVVCGDDVVRQPGRVRHRLGVVFQAPALDVRLTVGENVTHQGHLYGLRGRPLRARIAEALERVGLGDRRRDLVQTLSVGLQRRAELAKALLHQPEVLVLDEPTTGLDPGARRDVWRHLLALRDRDATTIVLTTHLMDEAARCDRVGIIHEGRLVAIGAPQALTDALGADVITIAAGDPAGLATKVGARFGVRVDVMDEQLRIERDRAHEFVPEVVEAFPGEIDAVTFGKPTLEDVFMHYTGRRLN